MTETKELKGPFTLEELKRRVKDMRIGSSKKFLFTLPEEVPRLMGSYEEDLSAHITLALNTEVKKRKKLTQAIHIDGDGTATITVYCLEASNTFFF